MVDPARILPEPEPAELMQAIAVGRDRTAFARLFEQYAPKVKAFLIRGGTEPSVAEELVQDIMLTVWRRADTFDPAQGSVPTWIFAIARNRRIDHLRRNQRVGVEAIEFLHGSEDAVSTDSLVETQQIHKSLVAAMSTLPGEQADVLRMAFFQHKSHSEIAERCDLPLGTVKSRIRLAMRHLRRALEGEQ